MQRVGRTIKCCFVSIYNIRFQNTLCIIGVTFLYIETLIQANKLFKAHSFK